MAAEVARAEHSAACSLRNSPGFTYAPIHNFTFSALYTSHLVHFFCTKVRKPRGLLSGYRIASAFIS